MQKVKRIIIYVLVISISLFLIDENIPILYNGNNIKIDLDQNHKSELETPHLYNFTKYDVNEKWTNSNFFQLSFSSKKFFLFTDCFDTGTDDYTGLVWQPPKYS